jgi:hypothetical protein
MGHDSKERFIITGDKAESIRRLKLGGVCPTTASFIVDEMSELVEPCRHGGLGVCRCKIWSK